VLSWDFNDLVVENKCCLQTLTKSLSTFSTKQEYLRISGEICIEEARANIVQSMSNSSNAPDLHLLFEKQFETTFKKDNRIIVQFRIQRGSREYCRPGWTFSLFFNDFGLLQGRSIAAVVAQGEKALRLVGADVVPLWIRDDIFNSYLRNISRADALKRGARWTASARVNLITYQRMSAACSGPYK